MPILHGSHTYNLDTTSGTLMCTFSFLLLIASIKSPEYLYFFIAQMYLEYFMIILEYLKKCALLYGITFWKGSNDVFLDMI